VIETLEIGDDWLEPLGFELEVDGTRVALRRRCVRLAEGLEVEVEGEGIRHPGGWLGMGQEAHLQGHLVRVVAVELPVTLVGLSGPQRGQLWSLGSQTDTHLGRTGSRLNQVVLEDPTVSRAQARILRRGGDFFVLAEAAKNPTHLNGRQLAVNREEPLKDGDLLRVGQTLLGFYQPTARSGPELRIYSLGDFEAKGPEMHLRGAQWRSQTGRFVLAYLALEAPRPVTVDRLLEIFWPDVDEERARANLRTNLTNLRQALKIQPLFQRQGNLLTLDPELGLWHDVTQLRNLLRDGQGRAALELYRGPYLEDCYLDFAVRCREELERQLVDAACALMEQSQDLAEVIFYGQRALQLDACCQPAALTLMKAYRQQGRPEESLRIYESLRRKLAQDMDLEPSLELEREAVQARLEM
jgi:DNA-binding SARP family transcriptional activator